MKVIYDNKQRVYIIKFEDIDSLPLTINTNDIVEARDYLVEHIVSEFNNALQEQLNEDGTDERYEDWCFDCDYCKNGTCEHDINCENGEMWEPKPFEDDVVEEGFNLDDLINVMDNYNQTNGYELDDLSIVYAEQSACDGCSNNPKNGGSGICNCTVGQIRFY